MQGQSKIAAFVSFCFLAGLFVSRFEYPGNGSWTVQSGPHRGLQRMSEKGVRWPAEEPETYCRRLEPSVQLDLAQTMTLHAP